MFPARAGMSRDAKGQADITDDVPRASGDEPAISDGVGAAVECSPRERG